MVQKMLVDAPSYDYGKKDEEIELTSSNAENILKYVNSLM